MKIKSFYLNLILGNKSDTWREVFSDKTFEQINLFIENLPVRNTDEVIQDLIHEILISEKSFNRNLINTQDDKMLFKLY